MRTNDRLTARSCVYARKLKFTLITAFSSSSRHMMKRAARREKRNATMKDDDAGLSGERWFDSTANCAVSVTRESSLLAFFFSRNIIHSLHCIYRKKSSNLTRTLRSRMSLKAARKQVRVLSSRSFLLNFFSSRRRRALSLSHSLVCVLKAQSRCATPTMLAREGSHCAEKKRIRFIFSHGELTVSAVLVVKLFFSLLVSLSTNRSAINSLIFPT